jgi:hypothetical protein
MGHKPLFCVVRCDAPQIGARKPQFFNEKMTIERDLDASRLIGHCQEYRQTIQDIGSCSREETKSKKGVASCASMCRVDIGESVRQLHCDPQSSDMDNLFSTGKVIPEKTQRSVSGMAHFRRFVNAWLRKYSNTQSQQHGST